MLYTVEEMARVCYAAQAELLCCDGDTIPPWDEAPPGRQKVVIESVEMILAGHTPPQLHQFWCTFWDANDPWHPLNRDWQDLDERQRVRERLFNWTIVGMALGVA